MRWHSQSTDPLIHEAAQRMARRFVYIIQAILREEEVVEALREAYQVAVDELQKFKGE